MVESTSSTDATITGARDRCRPAPTAPACRMCGTESIRHDARFCYACGAPLTTTRERAEYKQVTVLFADVVRSMHLASALDAERLREVMTEVFNRSAVVVHRYGGTVDKFTGDGIMALFGAPVALEDHAFRASMAALDIQNEVKRLAAEVRRRDDVALRLRVGLNSGQVIAGDVGLGVLGYTAIGEQVGMAQRMESVAQPGGVTLSESTARLVADIAVLAEPAVVHVKDGGAPVLVRRLLGMKAACVAGSRHEATLVGRKHEIDVLAKMLRGASDGAGCLASVVGPAGIGKSRLARELAVLAENMGAPVFSVTCESHTRELPFHVVARMLRSVFGLSGLVDEAARAQLRAAIPTADPGDLLLLDDLIGIGDPTAAVADIDQDARRRRLTGLVNAAALARKTPAMYVIEDVHWIDEASETMFREFLTVVADTRSMVLITHRPEYRGPLSRITGAHIVELGPLSPSEGLTLSTAMLGTHSSVAGLASQVADKAAGNPFFAEEIIRDLAERGVLDGDPGAYVCRGDITPVNVPATVQATIAARIDRLGAVAKETLNAAAVIGSRFDEETLNSLLDCIDVAELIEAELIDQVKALPRAEYAFRHPLIRTVAYESQLMSERADLHRQLAAAIEQRDPGSVEENAGLIATHLEAAGDLRQALAWHMRAGMWSTSRDVGAAGMGWRRARQAADRLPATADTDRLAMQIAPRILPCEICRQAGTVAGAGAGFDEIRELTTAAGHKRSPPIGMTGLLRSLTFHARYRESARLVAECAELVEEARAAIRILAAVLTYPGFVLHDIRVPRLHA